MTFSFPNRLILIIVITILLPIYLIHLVTFSYVKKEMQDDAASWLQRMTVNTGETIDSYTQLVKGLTKNPSYDYMLMNIFEQHLDNKDGLLGYTFEEKAQINGWLSMLLAADQKKFASVEIFDRNGNRFHLGQDIRSKDITWIRATELMEGASLLFPPVRDRNGALVFSVTRLLYNPQTFNEIGLIRIFFYLDMLGGASDELTQRGGSLFLINMQDEILFDFQNACKDKKVSGCIGPGHFQSRYRSETTGWTLVATMHKQQLFQKIDRIQHGVMIVNLLLFILSILIVVGVSYRISLPLKRLSRIMHFAPKVNFHIQVPESNRKDEIGLITSSFREMVFHLHELIAEVTLTEQKRKRSEIAALQAQINPHFLNNTLSAIAMQAEIDGNYYISSMASQLGKLLRYAIAQEREWVNVRRECEYIHLYVQVMQYRYPNVKLDLQVSEEVLEWKMIKLLLQPIVENAILHGLVPNGQQGTIQIRILQMDERSGNGLSIIIEDSGIGMNEEQIVKLRASWSGISLSGKESLGTRNVFERIQLTYGEGRVRFDVESQPAKGTRFIIELPRMDENENTHCG